MSIFRRTVCLLLYVVTSDFAKAEENERPYEFSFNLVDFQHRYEKKDAEGIVTGEYGFVTADGVYHETGYATDKNGDFLITKMTNRKITSLEDAQEIFKDKPEVAEKLVEALAKSCADCKIALKKNSQDSTTSKSDSEEKSLKGVIPATSKGLMQLLMGDTQMDPTTKIPQDRTDASRESHQDNERTGKSLLTTNTLGPGPDDLYYRFNYTITTHDHHEDGYLNGRKDGGYRTQSENGVDTRVSYLSNEFGHQPNITFIPRASAGGDGKLEGYVFRWYRQ